MRKILIPTDFSSNAMNAIKYAVELFKYDISKVFIMHAYQDDIYNSSSLVNRNVLDEITNMVSNESQAKLEDTLKQLHDVSPNPRHSYHIISVNGMLVDEVDAIVDKENIDVIVMGTRGETNDRRLTFGSHTLQVLKYVQCPVLAIPENYTYTQPKHILFPTNYLIPYKRRELKLLCELASPYRSIIDMLYISKTRKLSIRQEDNQNFIKEELCRSPINFKTIESKNIIKAIYDYVENEAIDMLVMVNTRHSFLEKILFKSTIDEISLQIKIPFLALQNIRRY
ncbi:universal stress protein [Mangrovimonas spongiae]|uniref:Universal stress protein n=1 Tax=Mangrovimonas spongiae TaxID=2494697 RepID=A0A428K222_9FLAO|nr:universal stress protein [Mangrovimonas spongiae]RSK40423.1 universal stress protein [Mangrovimonas spongiae]